MPLLRSVIALLAFVALATAASAEVVVVTAFGFYFSPREVVIEPGDSVRWVWTGGTHTVTQGTDGQVNGNELFHSPLSASTPTYTFTFTPAFLAANPAPGGAYDYFCFHHFISGMNGVIRVANPVPGTTFCTGDGSGAACPCNNASAGPVGCINSVNKGGRLRGIGSATVASDSLELWLDGPSEGSNVIFFQGSTTIGGGSGVPFGDGLRCAGGNLLRLGKSYLSFGWARYPGPGEPKISTMGAVLPGTTRYYQAWYFDSPGACGPAAANWSNGYSVTWQ